MPFKLTEEEKDQMLEMLESDAFKLLCEKILPAFVERKKIRAFSLSITSEADLIALAISKSKAEGAQDLALEIESLKKLVIGRSR